MNAPKSCLTTNREPYELTWINKKKEQVKITRVPKEEAVRFLGIWISLTLEWEKQRNVLLGAVIPSLYKLRNRKEFDLQQKVTIINLLIIPLIRFYMQFVVFDKETINTINESIKITLNISSNNNLDTNILRFCMPKELGGLNLNFLEDIQKVAYATNILNLGINFNHEYPRKAIIERKKSKESLFNEGKENKMKGMIENLRDIIVPLCFTTEGWNLPLEERQYLYEGIEQERLELSKWKITKNKEEEELLNDTEYDIIGTDGSYDEKSTDMKVGSAIVTNNINNKHWQSRFTNTNLGAELEAILVAISTYDDTRNIIIATDSLNSINLIKKKNWKSKEKYNSEEYPIIENIQHNIKKREEKGFKVVFEHVRSHQDSKKSEKDIKKIEKRKEEMDKKYENSAEIFKEINILADEEANKGRKTQLQPINELTKGMPMIVLKKLNENKFITGNFKGIIKNILKQRRIRIQKQNRR